MGQPKEILLIRHAEEPTDNFGENLSIKGYERAAALAYYLPDAFGQIDYIFAAGAGFKSYGKYSIETVTPLAKRLDKKINDTYLRNQYWELFCHIGAEKKYTDTTILIAWPHKDIEAISSAFRTKNIPATPWPEDRYDLVWKLILQSDRSYTLAQIPQLLLYGDIDEIIQNPLQKSFCEELQTIDPRNLCGTQPILPAGNFPNIAMTCIFKVPKYNLPEGLTEQFIFVGAGFLVNEQAIIDNQIGAVLNVAHDEDHPEELQIPFSDAQIDKRADIPFPLAENERYYLNQLAKVGLVDGNKNDIMTLIAAVMEMERLLNFPSLTQQKENGLTNFYAQGNLVVHCHDGGSRSVTIAALYLYYKYYAQTDIEFEDIYRSVICLRWNHSPNNHPTQGICENAYEVLNTFEALFPEPIRKKI